MKKHEMVYVFYKKLPLYDLSSHSQSSQKQKIQIHRQGVYNKVKTEICNKYEPPLPNSILEIKSEKGKHPTQKPTALVEWCLKYYSKEGDTVLDPTMGSGSTGVACKNLNRQFIGIEQDEKIFKVAQSRIEL
jgi:DNA modification methylase